MIKLRAREQMEAIYSAKSPVLYINLHFGIRMDIAMKYRTVQQHSGDHYELALECGYTGEKINIILLF